MNTRSDIWTSTCLFKFRGAYPNPLGNSAPLLCSLIFGGEGEHGTKQRGYNFTKNNCVIAFAKRVIKAIGINPKSNCSNDAK